MAYFQNNSGQVTKVKIQNGLSGKVLYFLLEMHYSLKEQQELVSMQWKLSGNKVQEQILKTLPERKDSMALDFYLFEFFDMKVTFLDSKFIDLK